MKGIIFSYLIYRKIVDEFIYSTASIKIKVLNPQGKQSVE